MFKRIAISVATALTVSLGATGSLAVETKAPQPIKIAQFGHVFLYMPLYVAVDKGFFKQQGLDVRLISTGGDEKTFAAVSAGNCQFGVSDPTFAAIAREHGQGGRVVAGVVHGMPFWVVSFRKDIKKIEKPEDFKGYRIATYTAPSTCYAIIKDTLQNGGHPVEAKIVQGAFGTLPAMLKANQADMACEIEPNVSQLTHMGGTIVYSPVAKMGDFAFTGLEVSDDYYARHPEQIQAAVNAITKAMNFIKTDFNGTLAVAKQEFPEVPEPVLDEGLRRLIRQGVIPKSPVLTREAWDKAIKMRRELGDIKGDGSFDKNVDMKFAIKAFQ